MSNSNYVSGRRFEYAVRDYFEAHGYTVVRSAGSHTPIDLVAFDESHIYLIQCKKGKIIPSEIKGIIYLAHKYSHVEKLKFLLANPKRVGKRVTINFHRISPAGNLYDYTF